MTQSVRRNRRRNSGKPRRGQQAEEIIAEARSGAAAQKSELIRQAREKAVQTENAAKAQADRITADAEQAEGAELESLRSAVTEKSDQAVKAVLAELL